MDKISERLTEKNKKDGWFNRIKASIEEQRHRGENDKRGLAIDLGLFAIGFVLSRCHLAMGAYPLALAFIASLPFGVWYALFGAVMGAFTLGGDGIVFAAACAMIALLRSAMCTSEKESGRNIIFGESILLRASISVIGGFVVGLYRVLLDGTSQTSLLFGVAMVILPPVLTFIFSGLYIPGVELGDILSGEVSLSLGGKSKSEKQSLVLSGISALMLIFFLGLSFRGINLLGISISYIFSSFITLATAKRFGALRAMAVGFMSAVGISAVGAVGFGLMGLVAGLMFAFGTGYATLAGGFVLCIYSGYTAGLSGLLSTLPEYMISSALALPLIRKMTSNTEENTLSESKTATDMVGIMALTYQNRYSGSVDALEGVLLSLAEIFATYPARRQEMGREDYKEIVESVTKEYCRGCMGEEICEKEGIRTHVLDTNRLTEVLLEGRYLSPEDINRDTEFCQMAELIADGINTECKVRENDILTAPNLLSTAEDYNLISALIKDCLDADERERTVDISLSDRLSASVEAAGLSDGVIRVFGQRKKHFILAAEDDDGSKITSHELRRNIEECAKVKLGTPEYFRRGKMVVMECGVRPLIKVKYAYASTNGNENEPSGDTLACLEEKDTFYSLISDGMGSGVVAKDSSEFVSRVLSTALNTRAEKETLLHILNHSLKSRKEECSVTVDLFELDLISGKGAFVKSGAAPSFIKRGDSIFRIRSTTAPLGVLSSIDSEKIRVEIAAGDHIIMLSDGICATGEDAPWLLLLLGENPKENLKEYAESIIAAATTNGEGRDDMSVIVMRIEEV